MGAQRKRAFRAEDQVDQGGKVAKRQRKKGRPAVRRLCKGMCYNDPRLEPDDLQWEGQPFSPADGNRPAAPPSPVAEAGAEAEPEQPVQQQQSTQEDVAPRTQRLSGKAAVQMYLQRLRMEEPTPLQGRRGAGAALLVYTHRKNVNPWSRADCGPSFWPARAHL